MESLSEHDFRNLENAVDSVMKQYNINGGAVISQLIDDLWKIGVGVPDKKPGYFGAKKICSAFYSTISNPEYDYLWNPQSHQDKLIKLFLLSYPFNLVKKFGTPDNKGNYKFNYNAAKWASNLGYVEFVLARYGKSKERKSLSKKYYETQKTLFKKSVDHLIFSRNKNHNVLFASRIIAECYLNLGCFEEAISNYRKYFDGAIYNHQEIQKIDQGISIVFNNPYRMRKARTDELNAFEDFYNDEFVEFCEKNKNELIHYSLLKEFNAVGKDSYCTNVISDIVEQKERYIRGKRNGDQKWKRRNYLKSIGKKE